MRPPSEDTGTASDAHGDDAAAENSDMSTPHADGGNDADVAPDLPSVETPPEATITAPEDGSAHAYFSEITFAADVSDREGDVHGDHVVWTSDLAGELGRGVTLTATLAPAGDHVVTCTATDQEGHHDSDDVTVTIVSPMARILQPSDGETRRVDTDVSFIGHGGDIEDGDLEGGSMVWTSDLDGEIGHGVQFYAPLSEGTHTITLTVTDSDQHTDESSITLEVVP